LNVDFNPNRNQEKTKAFLIYKYKIIRNTLSQIPHKQITKDYIREHLHRQRERRAVIKLIEKEALI